VRTYSVSHNMCKCDVIHKPEVHNVGYRNAARRGPRNDRRCVRLSLYFGIIIYSIDNNSFTDVSSELRWLGSRVVSVLDSGAEGLGSNRSRDAVG